MTDPLQPSLLEAAPRNGSRACDWCGEPIPAIDPQTGRRTRSDAEVCGVVCRKRRWRFQRAIRPVSPRRAGTHPSRSPATIGGTARAGDTGRFAYADPPYPGKADLYPERREVDHAELIARLEAGWPDGWALSTSAEALRDVLPLCPPGARVCVWRRRVWRVRARRALSAWEPLIIVGGRPLSTDGVQDLLDVLDYRGRYDAFPDALVGMKPPEFAVWLFRLLGARPGDELADLYPGSGAIGRAWELYTSRGDRAEPSPEYSAEPSRPTSALAVPEDLRDGSA